MTSPATTAKGETNVIRQNAFNQLMNELRPNFDEVKDVPALYVAHMLGQRLLDSGSDLRMGIEGIEVTLGDFSVNGDGEIQIDYYNQRSEDDRRDDFHQAWLVAGYELRFVLNNTWFHQPPLEVQPTRESEEERNRDDHARARRQDVHRERLEAIKYMDPIDLDILRTTVSIVQTEALDLMRTYWTNEKPQKKHKKLTVGSVVYNLYERDRLNAAWEVRAAGLTTNQDYELLHLRTGGIEPGFSGDYGTLQEWLKYQASGRGKMVERIVYNNDERDFLGKAQAYIEGKYRTKSK